MIEMEVEKVALQIYYESLCPDCRSLDSEQLVPLIRKLGYFLNIVTYPYGNAKVGMNAKQSVYRRSPYCGQNNIELLASLRTLN